MRPACLFCVTKHLSQATILLGEVPLGYPEHIHLAVGHLAEAEHECVSEAPELAQKIRAVRLILMGQDKDGCIEPDTMMNLIRDARLIAEQINGISELERINEIMCRHRRKVEKNEEKSGTQGKKKTGKNK